MWTFKNEKLRDSGGLKFAAELDSRPATFADVIAAWQEDADFRSQFNALLAAAPYSAFRWETPAVSAGTRYRPFEFVLNDSPELDRGVEEDAFAEHFANAKDGVAVFSNLGGDAILIVPCPLTDASAYGHLASFVRQAPEAQQHAVWRAVGDAMARRVAERPVWLSTAGAGVSWLHIRLDDRPKYYVHDPYRRGPE